MPKPPILNDEAREEMPGARDKVKDSKGTFVLWVVRVLTFIVMVVCPLIYFDLKSQIKECKSARDEVTVRLLNKLESLSNKVDNVETKADTTLTKVMEGKQK